MGSGNFNPEKYKEKAKEAQVSKNSGFTATKMCDEFNPAEVDTRWSKKGPFNEFREPITVLVGLDVTGSMGVIPKNLLTGDLGKLMDDVKKICNSPYENVQISFAAIGDVRSDKAPLQVTHFESDNRFVEQLQKIWIEGGGGPLGEESYNLLWWYAANKTQLNYVERDKRKGILITMGDENVYENLTAGDLKKCFSSTESETNAISNKLLLEAAREQYEVYHLLITDGSGYNKEVAKNWKNLLGKEYVIEIKSQLVAGEIAKIITRHRPPAKENLAKLTEEQWSKNNKENLTDEQWEEVLNYTLCPLSGEYMKNPRELGNNKKVYEKEAIEKHLKENKTDPFTNKKLTVEDQALKPNLNIAQLCSNYKPYFDALPMDRRMRLVKSILDQKNPEHKKSDESNKSDKNPYAFFQNESEQNKIFEEFERNCECPLTHQTMIDPVILVETGQSYEREAIEKWLKEHDTDPLTNGILKDKTIIPNYALKTLCDRVRDSLRFTN